MLYLEQIALQDFNRLLLERREDRKSAGQPFLAELAVTNRADERTAFLDIERRRRRNRQGGFLSIEFLGHLLGARVIRIYRATHPPHTGNTWPTKQLAAALHR